jgi:hypothetical protein
MILKGVFSNVQKGVVTTFVSFEDVERRGKPHRKCPSDLI